jgi:hypothetical protein
MTLWYRLPMLASFMSSRRPQAEVGRMVSEKASALMEGMLDAQIEAMRIAGAAVTGRLDFSELAQAPAALAAAGLRPAFRCVKANSRRLHRQGKRSAR